MALQLSEIFMCYGNLNCVVFHKWKMKWKKTQKGNHADDAAAPVTQYIAETGAQSDDF